MSKVGLFINCDLVDSITHIFLFIIQIIDAFATRKGIANSAFRFMFDGKRVMADHTPKTV
jgi:hypothetical protein